MKHLTPPQSPDSPKNKIKRRITVGVMGSPKKNQIYKRGCLFLKGQCTVLTSIKDMISQKLKENENNFFLKHIIEIIEKILTSNLSNLFLISSEIIDYIRNQIDQNIENKTYEKIYTIILISALSFRKFSSSLLSTDANENSPLFEDCKINNFNNKNNSELEICRICDESVPLELFDDHSKSCSKLFQSKLELIELDEGIKEIMKNISLNYLNVQWSNLSDSLLISILPMLQLYFLLENALNVDANLVDSSDELQQILNGIFNMPEFHQYSDIHRLSFEKVKDKLRRSMALFIDKEIFRKTTISGNFKSSSQIIISINDFDFIKRISRGAYARVFLTKKKTTGDIFAIKVLPKSELTQKNQVKRVLAEKDILLQFNNPFLVDFCMYFYNFFFFFFFY